jgi:gamma-butyrobetaine dioxygenase
MALSTYQEIEELFTTGISEEYLGEDVKLVEHMLQCADLARESGASDELIVAALLHDIGHLLVDDAVTSHNEGHDAHHDIVGAQWVAERFPESISEPVRLHVAAKRYLVSIDPAYRAKLSEASIHTLNLQGGEMTAAECEEFLAIPGAKEGISLRIWDDLGKVRDKPTSNLADFKAVVSRFDAHT